MTEGDLPVAFARRTPRPAVPIEAGRCSTTGIDDDCGCPDVIDLPS